MKALLSSALLAVAPAATVRLQESGAAKVGAMAPSFGGWDLAGEKVLTLDLLRRTPTVAPLLITFGASWCTPCAVGLPRLKAVCARNPELRLVFIDVESDQRKAQDFVARIGIDGAAIHDKFGVIAKTYGLSMDDSGDQKTSLPRTLLLDAKGHVVAIYRQEGPDLEQVIEQDLARVTKR